MNLSGHRFYGLKACRVTVRRSPPCGRPDCPSPAGRAPAATLAGCVLLLLLATPVRPEPLLAPGDLLLRHDLELLNDSGEMSLPLSTWPLSADDLRRGLSDVPPDDLTPAERAAWERVQAELARQSDGEVHWEASASAAEEPRRIRTFADTPRADAEASGALAWAGNRLALRLQATLAGNPLDDDEVRPDGTYVALTLGNWIFSAGWQDRWWGPGHDGSLVLSTSARPAPGIAFQRNSTAPFESKWLSWIGPWTLTGFLTELDDERFLPDTRLVGMRFAFAPIESLEIGLSRTAQWCGEGRPCDFGAFSDLLLGRDNRGVNVDPEDEPGNQLAGFDMRWRLPRQVPAALYMQWIGEDSRQGGPQIGSWLRQVGIEFWGGIGTWQHRTHVEVSDTRCREGGFGFAEAKADCGYEHSIYRTGYRYRGQSIGHGADGDSLIYSFGSTLVQSAGRSWNLSVRHMEINRAGAEFFPHSISVTPQDITDVLVSHDRLTDFGRWRIGLGYQRLDDDVSATSSDDVEAFITWSSH